MSQISILEATKKPVLEDISVVIPTLGRPILEQSLGWIARGTAWPAELILVDQGASDLPGSLADALNAIGLPTRLIKSNQRGRALGVNRGIETVKTAYFAVTDDDCFVEPDWLENMLKRLQEQPLLIVTGRVEAAGEGTAIVVTSRREDLQRRPRLKFDRMSGGNMATSLAVIEITGLFDEDARLRTAEDAEWSYRALSKGIPILYAPEVCVHHFGWRDEGAKDDQVRSYARSHGGFYGKYIRQGDLFILARAFLHHVRALTRWMRGAWSRNAEMRVLGRGYFLGLLPGILAGMRESNGGQSA